MQRSFYTRGPLVWWRARERGGGPLIGLISLGRKPSPLCLIRKSFTVSAPLSIFLVVWFGSTEGVGFLQSSSQTLNPAFKISLFKSVPLG